MWSQRGGAHAAGTCMWRRKTIGSVVPIKITTPNSRPHGKSTRLPAEEQAPDIEKVENNAWLPSAASGQVYGLWPGRLLSRDNLRCIAVVTRKRSNPSHYHRYRPCVNHELQSSRSVLRGLGSRVSAARFVWGWLVPPAALVFSGREHWHSRVLFS